MKEILSKTRRDWYSEFMKDIHLVSKELGETPLQCMNRLQEKGELPEDKLTYAGRLDPAAEGLLLVLSGEERFKKDEYLSMPKTYEFSFVLGISTDTYDLLGIPTLKEESLEMDIPGWKERIKSLRSLPYPPYSSRTVEGKPLWTLARKDEVGDVPSKDIEIYSIQLQDAGTISTRDLRERLDLIIKNLEGDFRQNEIKKAWDQISDKKFQYFNGVIECSSGTYVRSIVNLIGELSRGGATTFSIRRTKVGDFSI